MLHLNAAKFADIKFITKVIRPKNNFYILTLTMKTLKSLYPLHAYAHQGNLQKMVSCHSNFDKLHA